MPHLVVVAHFVRHEKHKIWCVKKELEDYMKGLHTSRLVSHVGEECRKLMSSGVIGPRGSEAAKCICRLDEHGVSVDTIGGRGVP